MKDTIFMKIIRKEIPADIVYEDDKTLAFLDIEPITLGHTLVIPKKSVQNIFDVDEDTLNAVMNTVRKIAPAVRDGVGASAVHINSNHGAEAGQIVPHLHIHIIPRHSRNEFSSWQQQEYPSETIASETAKQIRKKIN